MSISAIDINGFKSTSLLSGTHKAARFICVVEPPSFLQGESRFDNVSLAFLCNAASIPAVNIQTTEEQHLPGVSLTSHMPYGVTMGELQLRYYIDNTAQTYEFFSAWLRNVVNHGAVNEPFRNYSGYNGAATAEVQYKSHYASTVRLYALDINNDSLMEVVFYDAFPTGLSDVQFDWSTTDDISSFTVTMSYYTYVPMNFALTGSVGGPLIRSRSVRPDRYGVILSPDEMESLAGSVTHTLTSSILPGLQGALRGALSGSLSNLGRSIVSAATGGAGNALNTLRSLGSNIQNYKSNLKANVVTQARNTLSRSLINFP